MAWPYMLMLAVLPLLLVLSGFLSGSETSFFSLSRHQRLVLSRSGTVVGSMVTGLVDQKRLLLITLMLGNMLVNVTFFSVSEILLLALKKQHLVGVWVIAVLHVAPLIMLIVFGEVLPKLVASRYALRWARLSAVLLWLIHRALAPIRLICSQLVIQPLARLISPGPLPHNLSPKELQTLLELSQESGVIDHSEEQMLQQVLTLGQLRVQDLMTPRVDIVAFDLDDDPAGLLETVRSCPLSRVPVYVDNLDNIEGVVYRRQVLLRKPRTTAQIQSLIRQVRYVPQFQRADALLVDLRRRGTTMAIVVDEYGGTAGLVTLEDVVEHMVGQIAGPDEPAESPQVQMIESGVWRVSADLSVREWAGAFGQVAPVAGVSTIGGLVMARLGRAAQRGDRAVLGNVAIEVETVVGRRIGSLRIQLRPPAEVQP